MGWWTTWCHVMSGWVGSGQGESGSGESVEEWEGADGQGAACVPCEWVGRARVRCICAFLPGPAHMSNLPWPAAPNPCRCGKRRWRGSIWRPSASCYAHEKRTCRYSRC